MITNKHTIDGIVFIIVSFSLMLSENSEDDKLSPCMTPHFCENVPLDLFDVLTFC